MALHAQRQRLDTGQDHEGVEGRDGRAEVAQAQHAAGDGEGDIAERLVDLQAVIALAGFGEGGVFAALRPVEAAAIDDHAAH